MSKITVYISGPMTGKPNYNLAEFENAEWELNQLGDLNVINPHRLNPPATIPEEDEVNWVLYLARDLHYLISCRAVGENAILVTLPGAKDSRGASLEIRAARALKIPVMEINEFKQFYTIIKQEK